jgi:hypothetical protein
MQKGALCQKLEIEGKITLKSEKISGQNYAQTNPALKN